MAIIYRLESLNNVSDTNPEVNLGAYRARIAEAPSGWIGTDEVHPAPWQDPLLKDIWDVMRDTQDENGYSGSYGYVFGFDTLAQLKEWFFVEHAMQELDELEAGRIGCYLVPDELMHKGRRQVIALSSEMKLIETRKCYEEK